MHTSLVRIAGVLVALGAAATAFAQQTVATAILNKEIPEFAGKEVAISTVVYPPGIGSAPHRHDAHTFVYVLVGSVVMQVSGGQPVTLGPGQTFYENPNDVHTTSKNASQTAPAKILVFMIKEKGKPATRPAQ
jgi:quercetin dioxygenase-like cupin family protein